jgi:hypothetical protein
MNDIGHYVSFWFLYISILFIHINNKNNIIENSLWMVELTVIPRCVSLVTMSEKRDAKPLKRISLMIREDQYEALVEGETNLSGLIRDLIDDHTSEHKIVLSVTEETKNLYETIISNTGSTDEDLEVYIRSGLKDLLKDRIKEMQALEKKLK